MHQIEQRVGASDLLSQNYLYYALHRSLELATSNCRDWPLWVELQRSRQTEFGHYPLWDVMSYGWSTGQDGWHVACP